MDEETDNGHKPPPPSIKKQTVPPPSIRKPTTPTPSGKTFEPNETQHGPALQVHVNKNGKDEPEDEENQEPEVAFTTRVAAMGIDIAVGLGLYLAVVLFAGMTFSFIGKLAWPLFMAFILTRDGIPFLKGQSPGKTAMKIKAVTKNGDSLAGNWEPALIRNAVLLIPLFQFVELVVLIKREDTPDQGTRLGDEWAKTKVIAANNVDEIEDGETEEAEQES